MIIISTSRGLFNLHGNFFFHEDEGVCFGLAHSDDILYAGFRGPNETTTTICSFDKDLNFLNKFIIEGCQDVHGIEVFNGSLFVVSTKTNEIFETDLEGQLINIHKNPIDCSHHSPHINTIKKDKDGLLLLSHRDNHNQGSCLYLFDPIQKQSSCLCRSLGDHSHSILSFENDLWICDSLGGTVFKLQGDIKNKQDEIKKLNVFKSDGEYLLRGLEFDNKYIYVGASQKAVNAERHKDCNGYILLINKDDRQNIKTKLIKNCGQVNEILRY
mgnify:CR=1 FL=1